MPRDRLADLPYAGTLTPHQGDLAADEDYEGAHFDKLDFDAPQAPGSRFLECAFTQVTVQDGRLRRARFNDVWLHGVRLTATELIDSSWIDATFIGSVAAGVIAHGSLLRQVTFRGCKLHGVNFRAATLTDVSVPGLHAARGRFRRGHPAALPVPRLTAPGDGLQPGHPGQSGPARRGAGHHHDPGRAERGDDHHRSADRAGPAARRARRDYRGVTSAILDQSVPGIVALMICGVSATASGAQATNFLKWSEFT